MLALVFQGLFFRALIPAKLLPTLFILIAPPAWIASLTTAKWRRARRFGAYFLLLRPFF